MSVVQSIRSALVPIHPEGYKFIAVFAALTLVIGFFVPVLFWPGVILTGWCAAFFRDPERVVPVSDDLVISPADGVVSSLAEFVPPPELGMGDAPRMRISVFMNVFNCHVNRAPVRGKILASVRRPGRFLSADLDKASQENERHCIAIDGPHGAVGTVQIAGLVARRILCFAKQDDGLNQGERFGLIRFGSRVDVYLPDDAKPLVALGQKMVAGETVIATHGAVHPGPVMARTI